MKTKNRIIRAIIALTQAHCLRSATMGLVFVMPLFGVDGCGHKH